MAVDGTWGDHVILHGAANRFQTRIHVISSLSRDNDVIISPECDVTSSNPLVLGHVHELHYVSLKPKQGNVPLCYRLRSLSFLTKDLKNMISCLRQEYRSLAQNSSFEQPCEYETFGPSPLLDALLHRPPPPPPQPLRPTSYPSLKRRPHCYNKCNDSCVHEKVVYIYVNCL